MNTILFELWKSCKNNCTFCVNKYMFEKSDTIKTNLIRYIEYLDNLSEKTEIGLVGGELFDGSLDDLCVKDEFFSFIKKICQKYKAGLITNLCLFTNLLYDSTFLINFLEFLYKNGIDYKNVKLSTSFDYKGRFLREESQAVWENNLKLIKEKFPTIEINCEMILTDYLCKTVLSDKINLKDFQRKYNIPLTLTQPYLGFKFSNKKELDDLYGGDFFLRRKMFINTCKYLFETNQLNDNNLFIDANTSDLTFVVENENDLAVLRDKPYKNSCMGRKEEHFGYIDSDKDIFEDIKRIANASG